ncbi:MAG: hypothetical protein AAGF44_07665 [Pseudomonadota bacterium]
MRNSSFRAIGSRAVAVSALALLAACGSTDQTVDQGIDNHPLEAQLAPAVWVAEDGCKHWIIDDGVEGYMSPILNADGTPNCA